MAFKLDPDNDPNEAYEVGPTDFPEGWFEVTCNGIGVKYFSDRAEAERYVVDPEYRKSLVPGPKLWEKKV